MYDLFKRKLNKFKMYMKLEVITTNYHDGL